MGRVANALALLVVTAGCGQPLTSRQARARLHPEMPASSLAGELSATELAMAAAALAEPRRQIVEAALAHAGMPAGALDCSALAQRLYATTGVSLPRTTEEQLDAGQAIAADAVQPGDLVFFAFQKLPADHVGVFAGHGAFVHVSSSQRGIRVDRLGQASFARAYVGARRYLQ